MIVDDFDIQRFSGPFWPLKTDSPLPTDANTEPIGPVTVESLKPVPIDDYQFVPTIGQIRECRGDVLPVPKMIGIPLLVRRMRIWLFACLGTWASAESRLDPGSRYA